MLTGAGELIAVGSGNPLSEEMYVGSQHMTYQGRLLAVVRSAAQAGEIMLQASTDGLSVAQITFKAI